MYLFPLTVMVSLFGQLCPGEVTCERLERFTLIDNEGAFGQICFSNAAGISSQQEQHFGGVLPDCLYTRLITQIQCCHLTGHSTETHTHTHTSALNQPTDINVQV